MLVLEYILSVIAPDACMTCGQEGSLWCEACRGSLLLNVAPACYRCGGFQAASKTCLKCRRASPLSHVWAASTYDGAVKRLVHELKFHSRRGAVLPIAEEIAPIIPVSVNMTVCHLPTTPRHRRQRGFDQSRRIAEQLAGLRDFEYTNCLIRSKDIYQRGASRSTRLLQIKGAFRVKDVAAVKGRHMLVIDDVMTTGASLEEAARTLKRAGAKSVSAAVFACRR